MTLKAQLIQTVADRQLTSLLQQMIHGPHHDRLNAVSDDRQASSILIGSTTFNDTTYVFTECGSYMEISTLLSLLNEITAQANTSTDCYSAPAAH